VIVPEGPLGTVWTIALPVIVAIVVAWPENLGTTLAAQPASASAPIGEPVRGTPGEGRNYRFFFLRVEVWVVDLHAK
jgi:hypothetical protein